MVCINFRNVIVMLIPTYGVYRVTSRSPRQFISNKNSLLKLAEVNRDDI